MLLRHAGIIALLSVDAIGAKVIEPRMGVAGAAKAVAQGDPARDDLLGGRVEIDVRADVAAQKKCGREVLGLRVAEVPWPEGAGVAGERKPDRPGARARKTRISS